MRNTIRITILIMLFLSSTTILTTKTNLVLKDVSADQPFSETSEQATVYVSPENITKALGETFTIEVKIANVTGLYGVDIRFSWDPTILEYVSHTTKIPVEDYSDGILHEPGLLIKDDVDAGTYWLSYASMLPAPVFTGTGIAFNMTFRVSKLSACTLDICRADLPDALGNPLSREVIDGHFMPTGAPNACFSWRPDVGVVGKPVIFNASESFTPAGTIERYYWDFDDGNTENLTNPVVSHTFNHADPAKETYSVSLIVENSNGINSTKAEEQVTIAASRNIKITSVSPSTNFTLVNSTVYIDAVVENDGSYVTNESCTLTACYNISATNWAVLNTTTTNVTRNIPYMYSFAWNTTGVEAEKYYIIRVNATTVPYEDETDNSKISEPLFITSKIIHDLAVESLMLQASHGGNVFSPPIIFGESALFTITIKNRGSVPEQAFNVTLYVNETLIKNWSEGVLNKTLAQGNIMTLTWTWDEISQRGKYNVTAQVTVAEDNDTQNNRLQRTMHVIDTPTLNITYTPETLLVNQTITLNASECIHGDPDGQITSYYWAIYNPDQRVDVDIPVYKSGISVSYNFTEQGNWTIVLRVKDNYGITTDGKRALSSGYELEMNLPIQSEGNGEDGEGDGGIPIEYIAVIAVIIVVVIAAFIVIRRRRSESTPAE